MRRHRRGIARNRTVRRRLGTARNRGVTAPGGNASATRRSRIVRCRRGTTSFRGVAAPSVAAAVPHARYRGGAAKLSMVSRCRSYTRSPPRIRAKTRTTAAYTPRKYDSRNPSWRSRRVYAADTLPIEPRGNAAYLRVYVRIRGGTNWCRSAPIGADYPTESCQ